MQSLTFRHALRRTQLFWRRLNYDADNVANPHQMNSYQETTNFGVEFFPVPEGSDFPPRVEDVLASTGADTGDVAENRPAGMAYQDYLDNMGAERLGNVDLGSYIFFNPTSDADAPSIITDLRTDSFTMKAIRRLPRLI